jgi:hypothetical protein
MDLSKLSREELEQRLKDQNNSDSFENQIEQLERLGRASDPNKIPFTETSDHTNVAMYTPLNKLIGPMHPKNAEVTMKRWKRAGYPLYLKRRTDQEVEDFKNSEFGKRELAKHAAIRKTRNAQTPKNKVDKMVTDVAVEVAKAVSAKKETKKETASSK